MSVLWGDGKTATFAAMNFIDTHTHLYLDAFDNDREQMMQRAQAAGVGMVLLPNIDASSVDAVHQMVVDFPGVAFAMMGLHPCSVQEGFQAELDSIEKWLFDHPGKYVAVGEIGIDLYWDKSTLPFQVDAFEQQIGWAKELGKPIVIHARDSFNEIFEVMDRLADEKLRGVFHCFTGNRAQAEKALSYGFYLGIGGVATYKNGGLDKTLPSVGLDKLILETDAPYLTPVPHRGKRNESSYIPLIANRVAEILNIEVAEVADVTTKNAQKLFDL